MLIKKFLILLLLLFQGSEMVAKKTPLSHYKKKRHFQKTPEPKPVIKKRKTKKPLFVIQKHAASHLHYDLRLEINGVMPSWAIPKGVPEEPGERRLAAQTEDHPIDYAYFEGIIPQGEYGGGTVMIWDFGTYENLREIPMDESLEDGKIEVYLEGKKIKGSYALIHTKMRGSEKNWLILKMQHEPEGRKAKIKITEKSVASGRTMKQITEQES